MTGSAPVTSMICVDCVNTTLAPSTASLSTMTPSTTIHREPIKQSSSMIFGLACGGSNTPPIPTPPVTTRAPVVVDEDAVALLILSIPVIVSPVFNTASVIPYPPNVVGLLVIELNAGVIVIDYKDLATGTMEESQGGGGRFTNVTLHPMVLVRDRNMIEKANELHLQANKFCFIANSCNFPILHKPICTSENA